MTTNPKHLKISESLKASKSHKDAIERKRARKEQSLRESLPAGITMTGPYVDTNTATEFNCDKHGMFEMKPRSLHYRAYPCRGCFHEADAAGMIHRGDRVKAGAKISTAHKTSVRKQEADELNRQRAYQRMIDSLPPSVRLDEEYQRSDVYHRFICDTHGEFNTRPMYVVRNNHPCPQCRDAVGSSLAEREVFDFVSSLLPGVRSNARDVLGDGRELDVYVPSHHLAVEFNGMYWHSHSVLQDKNYHLSKTELCEAKGIQLLHIWEYEWTDRGDVWKSIIRTKLGLSDRIYARKCQLVEVSTDQAKLFHNKNHLNGYASASRHVGLECCGELVMCMSVGVSRFGENAVEIIRSSCILNTVIVGGTSRLLTYINTDVVYYADRRLSMTGGGLCSIMKVVSVSPPSFWVYDGSRLKHRLSYTKAKMVEHPGYNPAISVIDNIHKIYNVLYDCGVIKYRWSVL